METGTFNSAFPAIGDTAETSGPCEETVRNTILERREITALGGFARTVVESCMTPSFTLVRNCQAVNYKVPIGMPIKPISVSASGRRLL